MSLEQEIQSQINDSVIKEESGEEPQQEEKKMVLPVSGVVNSIFLFLSKDWDEEDRKKLILDDMESENFNEMITPLILKVAEKLGLAVEEFGAIIGLAGLLLPRVFMYVDIRKKYSKRGEKENGYQGEEKENS